jgi:hypothetical protein
MSFLKQVLSAWPDPPALCRGRKNVLGPLHVPWEPWTSPNHFMTSHADWRKDYILNDHGLMQPVVIETVE